MLNGHFCNFAYLSKKIIPIMLQGAYHPLLVTASVLVAVFAAYTALSLAQRIIHSPTASYRAAWTYGSALVLGVGIWSMHFIGMLAFSMPIPIGHDLLPTVASLLVAVLASYLAIKISMHLGASWMRTGWGGIVMGSGIAAMHYIGMTAMRMTPHIEYSPNLVVLALLIAIAASTAALRLFSADGPASTSFLQRIMAALLLGTGISGMHYTGMASAHIRHGSVSGVSNTIDAIWLGTAIVIALVVMFTVVLILSEKDARRSIKRRLAIYRRQSTRESGSLKRGIFGPSAIYLAAALSITIVWASIGGMLVRERSAIVEGEKKALQRMASVVMEQARNLVSTIDFFLLSSDRLLSRQHKQSPHQIPEFQALVKTLHEKYPNEVEVRFADETGDLHTSSIYGEKPLLNIYNPVHFPLPSYSTSSGLSIGMPVWDEVGKKWRIPISYPLTRKAQQASAIVALLDVQALQNLYEKGRTKPNGSIALVHRNATVLARAPLSNQMVGKSIAKSIIWTQHLPTKKEGVTVISMAQADKIERITAYSALTEFPLVAISSSDLNGVLVHWWKIAYGSVLFGLFLTTIILFAARRLASLLFALEEAHDRVKEEAAFDALTGLPNRRIFHDQLAHEMTRCTRSGSTFALFFIDLDHFKQVNDSFGHETGDMLLKEAAMRLRSCVRSTDTVARLGGDEFTVIVSDIKHAVAVDRIVQEIMENLVRPYYLKEHMCYVSASIGVTYYPQDASTRDGLLKNADQAMYAAKNAGRNRWELFTAVMQESAQNRIQLLSDVRAGLALQQFILHYQPIVDPVTGRVRKAEALIRWLHPQKGFIAPGAFIPVIEETELIMEVGHWVFCEAARQAAHWRKNIHPDFQVSINVSPAQFKDVEGRMARWGEYLDNLGIPGSSIVLEITEGLILKADDSVKDQIRILRNAGIQFSMDDFGTGYSSLSYLKKFDFDFIKIDQSFVSGLGENAEDAVVCESIIAMAHKLGIAVIAEGVASQGQCDMLVAMGCDYAQGFLFSKAESAEAMTLNLTSQEIPLPVQ